MAIEVTTLDIPELEPYRTLRRPEEHWQRKIFVAEGEKVVRRLLQSKLHIVSFLMTHAWKEQLFPENTKEIAPVYVASKELLETIVGFPLHQGIMAVAQMPAPGSFKKFLHKKKDFLLVGLDRITSSENVGVIVRSCAAFGVDAIILDRTTSSPWLRRAVRSSMGGIFHVPVFQVKDLAEELNGLKQTHGFSVKAAHPAGSEHLKSSSLKGNVIVVFGSEAAGLSEGVLAQADEKIRIPMLNDTDSLNVATAAAVFLYEANRQRHEHPPDL
ncbi:MAG TPA: RNA methyltransferase [Acidobacteriota bacterium]|nr:RNA methyltransferase [Acidobacteriota bacterium]